MSKKVCLTVIGTAFIVATTSAASAQTQPWNEVFAAQGRFLVLNQFNDEAVLDRETGLVWQRAATETFGILPLASRYCADVSVGHRRGWRLPTLQELKSLTDPSESSPTLAAGHPFVDVDLTRDYWSSTTTLDDPSFVWSMGFNVGEVTRARTCSGFACGGAPSLELVAWCVRGGSGPAAQ
jgi:hypothetical protein